MTEFAIIARGTQAEKPLQKP